MDTPLDFGYNKSVLHENFELISRIFSKSIQMMKPQQVADSHGDASFAGNIFNPSSCLRSFLTHANKMFEWIFDNRTSNHMKPFESLLFNKYSLLSNHIYLMEV